MHFSVLGPLRVESASGPVEIRGAKERLLLARLVAACGRAVGTGDLVETLWGQAPPRSAAKSLQTFVVRLRNALEPDRGTSPSLLVTDGPGYRLVVDPGQVDAERFARLVATGSLAVSQGRPDTAVGALDEALGLWRGAAYSGFEEVAFAAAEARRLDELRLAATEHRMAAELALGRADAAVPELERMTTANPLRERAWELLVTALFRSGRQGEALAAYDRARGVLADQLGVDPGAGLRSVHARVLAQDRTLGRPALRGLLPPALRPRDGAAGIVGRERELERLRRAWTEAATGRPGTVVVRGPSGAGASALAAALATEVLRDGGLVGYAAPGVEHEADGDGHAAPLLLVLDHVDDTPSRSARDATLVLRLAGHLGAVPAGALVLDLEPLGRDALRELAGEHLAPQELGGALDEVVRRSRGWPGPAHEVAAELARARARRVVEAAASVAGSSQVELTMARSELEHGIERLRDGDRVGAGATDPAECPWRGLASYDVADARWFAGRDRLTAELVARLAVSRLLALVGASGAGKSSVLRAGLLAALAEDVLPGSGGWRVVILRPGAHPMQALARSALDAPGADESHDLVSLLVRDGETAPARVVVAVDQFEEVWTQCADETERRQFLDTLTDLATDEDSVVSVVLAVRSDRIGDLAEHPELRGLVGDGTVLVGPMTPAEVRRAVERPARTAGLDLDDGLADTVVSDAGDEPGLLPLLSTALAELWRRRDGRRLTYGAYVGLGGLDGAIATLAEEVWTSMPDGQQAAARRLLLRLAGPGEGTGVTRRRVPAAELEGLGPEVSAVVDELVATRLLTRSEGHVEVAHEALFREWPRLRGWLAEDLAGRAVQARLALAAAEWDDDDRDPALLWSGTRLVSGLDVAAARPDDLTGTEHEFLEAGRDAVDAERRGADERARLTARQNRRLRVLLVGLAVVLVAALVAGLLAWRSRTEAQAATTSADAKRLAATALAQDYPDTGLLAAVEATRLEDSPETYGALLTLLARQPEVIHRLRTPNRFLRMAVSTARDSVYVSENEPRLWSVDAASGQPRWTIDTAGQLANIVAVPGSEDVVGTAYAEPSPVLTRFRSSDGGVVWTLAGDDLVEAGLSEDPWLSWAVVDRRGRLLVETDSALVEVDPTSGRPGRAWSWPVTSGPSSQSLVAWPDGRVSREVLDSDPVRSVVIDPTGRHRPRTVEGRPLALTPDGRTAVFADNGESSATVYLVDARTLEPTGVRTQVDDYVGRAAVSADGSQVLLGTGSDVVALAITDLSRSRTLSGHSGTVMDLGLTDEDTVWTAGRDGTSVAFDLSGSRTTVVTGPGGGATGGQVPTAGSVGAGVVIAFDGPNEGWLLDAATGERLTGVEFPGDGDVLVQPVAAAIVPDGRTALFSLDFWTPSEGGGYSGPDVDRGRITLVDTSTGTPVQDVDLPWPVYGMGVTPDGRRVVLNAAGGIALLDLASGRVGELVPQPDEIAGDIVPNVAVSPDGRSALVGRVGRVAVVDLETMTIRSQRVVAAREDTRIGAVAWSADGRHVVVGDFAGWVHVLRGDDLDDAAPRRLVTAGFVIGAEVGSGGRVLATLGTDGDLTLWDTATWRPYGSPVSDDHGWGVLSVPADGSSARVLHEDGTTVEVSTDKDSWLRSACAAAGRDLTADEAAVLTPGRPPRATCEELR